MSDQAQEAVTQPEVSVEDRIAAKLFGPEEATETPQDEPDDTPEEWTKNRNRKSQKAMTKMQELNPKMQAIRARYKHKLKDKQGKPNLEAQRQMNDEVMALYRHEGVNPASGCLPILLQMPVFFAFYRLLTLAVELRHAPWILWIQDLSMSDPYYVLPLLMGATSVLLQRMSPAPPDPVQARLMQAMPIVFTVFAFAFPSGLVVYWLTNNLLTMVQQAMILRSKSTSEPKAA